MIFFALLVATLLDYNVPFAYEKRLNPYVLRWTATAQRWTSQQAGWVDWAVGVGLPVIATAVIFLALSAFASVLAWVWLVVVLYVFSGYGQFKDHMSPVGMFGRVSQGVADEGNNAFDTPAAVRFVLHRVVGYWVAFIVLALLGLGPAGAVLYRLAREKATPMTQSQAGEEPAVEEQAVEGAGRSRTACDASGSDRGKRVNYHHRRNGVRPSHCGPCSRLCGLGLALGGLVACARYGHLRGNGGCV